MAVNIDNLLEKTLNDKIKESKLLMVGAGGIGCELLKNLVLTGFQNIHVIDLDTIELSNLNRQFLFHKQHIGRPKAIVAKETAAKFNPNAKITAYHDSITSPKYDVEFYRQFSTVLNALDNVAARSHVNRMCLAADMPLIESGSSGYLGQVTVYKKKDTECFECLPRKQPKTYPGCTIRNTPSEPVHCVVWAKHLFNQLFGETDADQEVSPDFEDPELEGQPKVDGNVNRVSTRDWAKSTDYDPEKIFTKLFSEDIAYLNTMTDLWKKRRAPQALTWNDLSDAVSGSSQQKDAGIRDHAVWSEQQCADVFARSVTSLKKSAESQEDPLIWDKDDENSLDFVTACSNLRSYCFAIPIQSRFKIKEIAGNIIPAIPTTNAVVAGLMVLQLFNILKGDIKKCRTAFLRANPSIGQKVIVSAELEKPNPKCFVCSPETPEVECTLNLKTLNVRTLEEKILKEKLLMVQPDVVINDGTGKILISSDPEDNQDALMEKTLDSFKIVSDTKLLCEDFFQQYTISLVLTHSDELKDQDFTMSIDVDDLKSQQKENAAETKETDDQAAAGDLCEVEEDDEIQSIPCKRPLSAEVQPPAKKARTT